LGGNKDRGQVRLFVSRDKGRTYEPFWTFQPGDIKHVHNILEDPFEHCFWVFVGDHGSEPGIGRLSWNLKQLDWLVRGEQKISRGVCVYLPDRLVYATDTEMDYNGVYCVNKKTAATEKLADMPGSSIYSCRFGPWYWYPRVSSISGSSKTTLPRYGCRAMPSAGKKSTRPSRISGR
jgi:hypothetical protein